MVNYALFIDALIMGSLVGMIYAPAVMGFNIIYKSSKVLNFAHGQFLMIGAYLASTFWLLTSNSILTIFLALLFICLLGFLIGYVLLRPLVGKPAFAIIMVTIGLLSVLNGIAQLIWSALYYPAFTPFPAESVNLGSLIIPYTYIAGALTSLGLVALLMLFYSKSKLGISMRAAADDPIAAQSMGVSLIFVLSIAWILASASTLVSGILISNIYGFVSPAIAIFLLKIFVASLVGGLDSIEGALVGALIVGILDSFGALIEPMIAPGFKDVFPLMIGLIIIFVRPYGIFGTERIERL